MPRRHIARRHETIARLSRRDHFTILWATFLYLLVLGAPHVEGFLSNSGCILNFVAASDRQESNQVTTVRPFGVLGNAVGAHEESPEEILRKPAIVVGNPQKQFKRKERSMDESFLRELAAIQQEKPNKCCLLGTRRCSFLHQQVIELLAYALVLGGNHVFTSGTGGSNAAVIRGALRAEREDLLTVILPQSRNKQTKESAELISQVKNVMAMPENDDKTLDAASRICNSHLLRYADQLISFTFHKSKIVAEAIKEAKKLDMVVTTLYLD